MKNKVHPRQQERKPELLLAIDVGNSSITYGLFKSGRLLRNWYGTDNRFPEINTFIANSGIKYSSYKVIASSVNPQNIRKVKQAWFSTQGGQFLLIGGNIHLKIKHKYKNINQLGKDRLANVYGASKFYRPPILMINFGTATTFDLVSKKGVYEGGLIIPGIETSWKALQEKAALLPKLGGIIHSKFFIGRDTKSCMASGLLQGFGAMVDGLIERFKKRYERKLTVISSGGLAATIRPYVKSKMTVDQTHTLKSLALIYRDYAKTR